MLSHTMNINVVCEIKLLLLVPINLHYSHPPPTETKTNRLTKENKIVSAFTFP